MTMVVCVLLQCETSHDGFCVGVISFHPEIIFVLFLTKLSFICRCHPITK